MRGVKKEPEEQTVTEPVVTIIPAIERLAELRNEASRLAVQGIKVWDLDTYCSLESELQTEVLAEFKLKWGL